MPDETPAGEAGADKVPATTGTQPPAASQEYVSRTEYEAGLEKVTAAISGEIQKLGKSLKQSQKDVVEDRVGKMLGKYFPPPAPSQPKPESPAPTDPPQSTPAAPVSALSGFEGEIKQILERHQLSGEESELHEFAKANKDRPWFEAGPELNKLAAEIAARKAGSPAGVVPPTGNKPPSPNLAQEYIDTVAAARAAGRFGAGVLRDIKAQYRAKGLNVDNVRFEIPGVNVPVRGKSDELK